MLSIIISYAGIALIAIFQAIEDTLQYHHQDSVFKNFDQYSFWGKNSWVRKYKYGNPQAGPKFWGSKTFLVWITDGWHLVKFLWLILVLVICVLGSSFSFNYELPWYYWIAEGLAYAAIYGGFFELFYTFILRKR